MCVCNGARFLDDQLGSLLRQQRLPDEVVIGDDASEDDSVELVQRFAGTAPFPVRLIRNKERLGVRRNFEQVIARCRHDFIALCDQDDIWLPEKLAVLADRLEKDPDAMAAFSDAVVVDDSLRPLGYTMWEHVVLSPRRLRQIAEDRPWEALAKGPVVTGTTMMLRRAVAEAALPIPSVWIHDAWLAQIAAALGRLVAVKQPLVHYRQHDANVIGGKKLSLAGQLGRALEVGRQGLAERELLRYSELRAWLRLSEPDPRTSGALVFIELKLAHLKKRRDLSPRRLLRILPVTHEYLNGNYRRFATDWKTALADLLMP